MIESSTPSPVFPFIAAIAGADHTGDVFTVCVPPDTDNEPSTMLTLGSPTCSITSRVTVSVPTVISAWTDEMGDVVTEPEVGTRGFVLPFNGNIPLKFV